jgi:hypothetical protein
LLLLLQWEDGRGLGDRRRLTRGGSGVIRIVRPLPPAFGGVGALRHFRFLVVPLRIGTEGLLADVVCHAVAEVCGRQLPLLLRSGAACEDSTEEVLHVHVRTEMRSPCIPDRLYLLRRLGRDEAGKGDVSPLGVVEEMKQDCYFPQSEVRRVPEVWGPEECLQRCLTDESCHQGMLCDWPGARAVTGSC